MDTTPNYKGDTAGDDQAMAQKDRAGYHTDMAHVTGGIYKNLGEGCGTEVGNPQPIDGGSPIPKV